MRCKNGHDNEPRCRFCCICGVQFAPDPTAEDLEKEEEDRAKALVGADNLKRIDRIVVLVQENRSFDHMLGYLSLPEKPSVKGAPGGRNRADVCGLQPGMYNPGMKGESVEIRPLEDGVFADNPGHSIYRVAAQMAGGSMTGFVRDFYDVLAPKVGTRGPHEAAEQIMGYYTPAVVPVYDFLAENFTVCDHWFCAAPGPTWVNRMFLYAGTAGGIVENGFSHGFREYREYSKDMPDDLIVDRLDAAGVDWRIYHGSLIPWMKLFPSFRKKKRTGKHVSPYRRFDNDCRRGNLPPVVFIDGNANAFRDHPGGNNNDDQAPADVARGQELVGEVYETLQRHGQLDRTLFIVTYDEHGGFFDHMKPPDVPTYARRHDPWFTSLGVRVPALVISPYVDAKSVWREPLTHPSITHSILLRFCPDQEMTTRVHIAPNLGPLLSRETARELPSARSAIRLARRARSYRHLEDPDPEARLTLDVLRELKSGGL